MANGILVLVLATLAFGVSYCGRSRPGGSSVSGAQELARKELEGKGIPYTKEAFLERVKSGDTNSVNLFLTAGMDANTKYEAKTTPLMVACLFERAETIKALLNRGADVNAKDDIGRTPLIYAIQNGGDTSTVRSLLE